MTLPAAHKLFRKTFHVSLNMFLERELMLLLGKPIINIVKFDDWLHEKFGNYEKQELSMKDIITKHYDKFAASQIEELIG